MTATIAQRCIESLLKQCVAVSFAVLAAPSFAAEIGQSAPDFTLPHIDSSSPPISLSAMQGKTVYVDFWASWCAPCLRSMPLINGLYGKYKEQGFEVIAINVDDPVEDGREFLQDNPVDYLVALDTDNAVLTEYGVIGMPTSYLIDAQGRIRLVHMGFKEKDIDVIEQALQEVLSE